MRRKIMKRKFLIDAGGDEKLIINKWWPKEGAFSGTTER